MLGSTRPNVPRLLLWFKLKHICGSLVLVERESVARPLHLPAPRRVGDSTARLELRALKT
jgi:hypothetical protein